MTPMTHRVLTIVTMMCCFFGTAGLGMWLIVENEWSAWPWFVVWCVAWMAAVFGVQRLWGKLVPARCPECGTRCRLVDEPAGIDPKDGHERCVTRYYCPKCNRRIC
jgi:hypothetical protein